MKAPPSETVLCMQSGILGLALDVRSVRLLHAGRLPKPQEIEGALRQGNAGIFAASALDPDERLTVTIAGIISGAIPTAMASGSHGTPCLFRRVKGLGISPSRATM